MPETINTFKDGMRPDLAKSIPQTTNVISATNVRLVINEGQSKGVLSNVQGTKLSFDLNGIDPAVPNPIIISWATIRDDVYLFTTINDGNGQIWQVKYDFNTLVASVVLKYKAALNFTTANPIRAIGRYETANIQKLYWVEGVNGNNGYRYINIAAPKAKLDALNPNSTDVFQSVNFKTPIVKDLGTGTLPSGMMQYAYKLIGADGAETLYSPLSEMIHLVASATHELNSKNYYGNASTVNSGKSVTVSIDGIDQRFATIQIISIYRQDYGKLPTIQIIASRTITSTTIEITHSSLTGNETVDVSNDIFVISQYPFFKAEDIASKDNNIFVANTTGASTDILVDTRAYRYLQDGTAAYVIPDTVTSTFPEGTKDQINPYNRDPLQLYKYQKNGVRLGGGDPFSGISYTFKLQPIYGDSNQDDKTLNSIQSGTTTPIDYFNDGYSYYNNSFNNFKSPQAEKLKGYKRGETYRFGIVFYNKRGVPSFAKWIGDIRMPEASDQDTVTTYTINGTPYTDFPIAKANAAYGSNILFSLGLEFKVNLPASISSQIAGYQIVRVERTEKDKTCLTQGIVGKMYNQSGGSRGASYTVPHINLNTSSHYLSSSGIDSNSQPTLLEFNSPEISFYKSLTKQSGDYLQIVSTLDNSGSTFKLMDSTAGYGLYFVTKHRSTSKLGDPALAVHKRDVGGFTIAVTPGNTLNTSLGALSNQAFNMYTPLSIDSHYDTETFYAFHGTAGVVRLDNPFDTNTGIPTDGVMLVDYRRQVSNQYGGSSIETRGYNRYIPTSSIISINTTSDIISDTYVFGGDTYVTYFDLQRLYPNVVDLQPTDTASVVEIFPVESSINTEIRSDKSYTSGAAHSIVAGGPAYNKYTSETGNTTGDLYQYNQVFSSENNTKVFIAKPIDFVSVNEFDTRIYWSEKKINGELRDSWTHFSTLNYWDVEGIYGPIRGIDIFKDKLLFWQDKGFGMLPVNERALSTLAGKTSIQLSDAVAVLHRHEYISTELGILNRIAKFTNEQAAYFYDGRAKYIYRYTDQLEAISESKYVQSLLTSMPGEIQTASNLLVPNASKSNTRCGMTIGYDFWNSELLFTFIDRVQTSPGVYVEKPLTLVFNENAECFTSLYTIAPTMYISSKQLFLSNPTKGIVHVHNEGDYGKFYNTVYPSSITVLTNEAVPVTKTFDNYRLHTEASIQGVNTEKTFTSVQSNTDYQDSGSIALIPETNIRRRERTWQLAVPRALDLSRLRDKYLTTKFTLDNSNNFKLLIHYLATSFRQSSR
jgi:hypothetical protein